MHIVENDYFSLFTLHKHICVIWTFSLTGQIPAPSSPEKRGSSVYRAQFCLCVVVSVCLNSSKTARRTNIKLGTIDYHLEVTVLKGGSSRHDDVTIKVNFFDLHFWTEKSNF